VTTLSQADFRTLQSLGSEMQKLFEADLSPGEKVEFPASIAEGVGLLPLLDHLYGNPGDAETVRRMGFVDDVISYYERLLAKAARAQGLSDADLQALHTRNSNAA